MSDFSNVTVSAEANVYFDGQVTSRTIIFADGSKKPWVLCCPASMSLAPL